jgi:predicted  nucleic acid-binding Zn-ribbon protein
MCEYNNIKSQYEELEMKFGSVKKQKESNELEMKTIHDELKNQIYLLANEKNSIESNYKESLSEKEGYYENELRRVELEYQDYKDNSIEEYSRITMETHMKIEQLRNQSEIEVENLQRKLQSEREKCERKIRELTE